MLRPYGRRMAALSVSFTLNGSPVTVEIDPAHRLLDTLRYQLAHTGTKEGCGEGECGACTVRSEEHTSELQSQSNLVCRLLLEKKKQKRVLVVVFPSPIHLGDVYRDNRQIIG